MRTGVGFRKAVGTLVVWGVLGLAATPVHAESARAALKRVQAENAALRTELQGYESRANSDFNELTRLEITTGFKFGRATVALSSASVGGGHPASNVTHARVHLRRADGWTIGHYQNERIHRTRHVFDMNPRHFRRPAR